MLSQSLVEPLRCQFDKVRTIHEQDLLNNVAPVYLPYALERKYPNAGRELGWQYGRKGDEKRGQIYFLWEGGVEGLFGACK